MAGPVKTVSFIASVVIAWGLFVIGEAIVAWFDYKINGTEIPLNLQFILPTEGFPPQPFPHRIHHMNSILIYGLLLHGIRKETTRTMLPWMSCYYFYIYAMLFVILILFPILSYPSASIVSTNFLMPCPFTGPKMFWAVPNFLCQTKNLFKYCGSHKHFVPDKKMICMQ